MSSNSLWMGDIEPWMSEKYISSLYKNIANVVNVKLMKKPGMSIGYCFVEFENADIANYVLEKYNGKMAGDRVLKLSRASYSGGGGPVNKSVVSNSSNTYTNTSTNTNESQVYICDLDPSVTEEELKEFFSKYYVSVTSTKIVCDQNTRASRGFGFIRFKDPSEASRSLIEMNGKMLKSKPFKLK